MPKERTIFYINSDDTDQLMAILEDGLRRETGQDPTIGAIERLADLREKAAVPLLHQALTHSNVAVKTQAALALYDLGEEAGIDALIRFLNYDHLLVSAVRALARTQDEKAIDAVVQLKKRSGQRSYMFNGDMTGLSRIVETVLHDKMPDRFPPPSSTLGCFIATAVYGSPLAAEVLVFRHFRDKVLLSTRLGTSLVRFYYLVSPPLASLVRTTWLLKVTVRCLLLEPLLRMIRSKEHQNGRNAN